MDSGKSTDQESPVLTKKGKSKIPLKRKASALKQESPLDIPESSLVFSESLAEFLAENKNIAGFDNPGKLLYNTVREFVENALDSAESNGELPLVEVTIEEFNRSKFNSMIGLIDHERINKALYGDFETVKAREKLGKKVKKPTAEKDMKGRGEASIYRVTCKDNGRGMSHDDIPNMFGRVFFRKNYGMKQTRGKFGLGAKMALIWSKMSTGLPIEISSSMKNQNYTTFCSLDIDIIRNIPNIHLHEKRDDMENWHGTEIQVVIEGNWTTHGSKILEYMRQMAVITPYAEFMFRFVADTPGKSVDIGFERRTKEMPPVPVETKYHPSAVDLLIMERLIGQSQTSNQNLFQFLVHEFVNIDKAQAKKLIGEMGPNVTSETQVNSLTFKQIVRMHQLFRKAKFNDPSGNCLSPLGEYEFSQSIYQVMHPEVVATCTAKRAQVYQGHPFIVEAGVSLGGQNVKHGLNIFRFANRVPLLFEDDVDVVTKTAMNRIKWGRYNINKEQDKIGVFVHIVSTKIPFKGTRMEYIGDDISKIADAVKTCLEDCCKQLEPEIYKKFFNCYGLPFGG